MNTTIVAENLRFLRQKSNLTQEALAEKVFVSRQAVSKWETGHALPDIEMLIKLSHLYKISINEMVEHSIQRTIHDFEDIIMIEPEVLLKVFMRCDMKDIARAAKGSSPEVVALIKSLFISVEFMRMYETIGFVKVIDVEKSQRLLIEKLNNEISMISLGY